MFTKERKLIPVCFRRLSFKGKPCGGTVILNLHHLYQYIDIFIFVRFEMIYSTWLPFIICVFVDNKLEKSHILFVNCYILTLHFEIYKTFLHFLCFRKTYLLLILFFCWMFKGNHFKVYFPHGMISLA